MLNSGPVRGPAIEQHNRGSIMQTTITRGTEPGGVRIPL
jgi:hypothetical protein